MKILQKIGITAAGGALLAIAGQSSAAWAYDPNYFNVDWLSRDGCVASLDAYNNDAQSVYKVQAMFAEDGNAPSGTRCVGWLTRSTDYGQNWSQISGTHTHSSWDNPSWTSWYWDGPGYRAKACMIVYRWDAYQGQYCTQTW
ncbi:hypothetical protein [Kitasatospora sp. GP82]|uniref:hypothetical protein n=1 Tax=Kitasatospora sp. GP82 TaxID=3035089 RepID=UPI00247676E7|nr:hypothetical protein [Kitasatospora sp. GP82]MDH6129948.1 hypothetical protein [Kitasatospora sp. GP82]